MVMIFKKADFVLIFYVSVVWKSRCLINWFKISETDVATVGVIQKKVFLKKLPNSQDCTCANVWHRHFIGNFLKFLRTSFLQNTSGQLLLVKIREYVEKDLCFWWRFVNMLKKIYCYRKLTFECFNILKESYYVLATLLNYIWTKERIFNVPQK